MPSVGAVAFDGRGDAGVDLFVLQGLAGALVHEQGQRRAPGPLAADQPVRPVLHHGPQAVVAGLRVEGGGVDGRERRLAQGLAAGERGVHADEPLGRVAEDDRGF